MRKLLKILHSLASCGLIGGLLAYMIVLLAATPGSAAAYADMRGSIAAISNWLLLPSLAIALLSGLLAMAVHKPFLDKGWVWIKAAMGILMFKGVLTIVGAKANYAAGLSERIANGEAAPDALSVALAYEWYTLGAILALSAANVVLGVWRPALKRRAHSRERRVANTPPPAAEVLPLRGESAQAAE